MGITLLDEYSDEIRRCLRLTLSNKTSNHSIKLGPNAKSRKLLNFSGEPDPDLWVALCNASLTEGDKYCFLLRLSFYEAEVGDSYWKCNDDAFMRNCYKFPFLWRLDCNEPMQLYQSSPTHEIERTLILEYVIFSSSGTWSLIKPIGQYAFLVGEDEFIAKVEKAVPNLNEDIRIFLRSIYLEFQYSPNSINIDAIKDIILPIYGAEEADNLLQKSGLV